MTSSKLPNYLRANRKRLALSQDEVAFLLGVRSGAKVSRNESLVREPSLATAFAYEVIYGKPARELFGGLYEEIKQEVASRAKTLTYRNDQGKPSAQTVRKRQTLASIASRQSVQSLN